jgi:phage FluMu gp28-like protein
MREELDAIPRDGSSVCLPTLWVERAMTEARTVLRLSLGDDFTELTPDERDAYIDDWIQRYLEPELQKLDKANSTVLDKTMHVIVTLVLFCLSILLKIYDGLHRL